MMAIAALEPLVAFWSEWGIHLLVLLSFALQVVLLVLADIRRRTDSGVIIFVVWSAYVLADSTAVYALGHFSVTSRSPERELMAFWAPFLLVHLGGPGNITAYAVEDNRLWLRHLQAFGLQAVAAGYVLYQSSILHQATMLRPATILMCVVGILKYGERILALRRASGVPYWTLMGTHGFMSADTNFQWNVETMYREVQTQISGVYDLLYTKSALRLTWYGICIRVISPLATVGAFVLFHRFTDIDGYNRMDVTASYILLVGAVILETTSVLRTVFSGATAMVLLSRSWRWSKWLGRMLESSVNLSYRLARKIGMDKLYWSGSMRQHNFMQLCTRNRDNPIRKLARWMGREDWWDTLVYSRTTPVSNDIIEVVIKMAAYNKLDVLFSPAAALEKLRARGFDEEIERLENSNKVDENTIVWHIATDIYLSWYKECLMVSGLPVPGLFGATKALSNYMLFLLVARPYMLLPAPDSFFFSSRFVPNYMPRGPADCTLYDQVRNHVTRNFNVRSAEELITSIRGHHAEICVGDGGELNTESPLSKEIFDRGCRLGKLLTDKGDDMLELIAHLWVYMLKDAGSNRCSLDFHVKRLSSGGEFLTVLTLLVEYKWHGDFDKMPRGIMKE